MTECKKCKLNVNCSKDVPYLHDTPSVGFQQLNAVRGVSPDCHSKISAIAAELVALVPFSRISNSCFTNFRHRPNAQTHLQKLNKCKLLNTTFNVKH